MPDWTPESIRELMEQRGEGPVAFAKSMRTTRDAVQRWLAGSSRPGRRSRSQLNRLAAWQRRKEAV